MNANPFTNGHLHLARYAAANADNLYIFVVEENKSFFTFEDRIRLIREGLAEYENIIILPSSQYIISSSSLPGYFRKDELQGDHKLDATQDLRAFAQAAQMLNITIRFAGEEPMDQFTDQYNSNMKKILPQYGIEFHVIPRKLSDNNVISASFVRKLLIEGDMDTIREIVPPTTYNYLLSNRDTLIAKAAHKNTR